MTDFATTTPGITCLSGQLSLDGAGLSFPFPEVGEVNDAFFGPNLLLTVAPSAPEPASVALLGLALPFAVGIVQCRKA